MQDTGLFCGGGVRELMTHEQLAFDTMFSMTTQTGWYHLYYNCDCGEVWEDEWDCLCNDKCPMCNKETQPSDWREVE